jgi:general secretion pathway protein J
MTHRPHLARSESGFTLIELLVSLSLLILMLALINGAFGFGLRAWEMTDEVERARSMEAFRNLLQQRLSEAMPLMSSDERGVLQLAFHGDGDGLRFVTPMPSRGGLPAGLYEGTFSLIAAAGRGRPQLALSLSPLISANNPSSLHGYEPVLLAQVADLAIRYYGPPGGGGEPRWFDEWLDRQSLPQLVWIAVGFPAGDRRNWPPLTAELRLGAAHGQH